MALSVDALLGTAVETTNTATIATGTLSPTANALLLVRFSGVSSSAFTISSVTDTFTGTGAWTLVSHAAAATRNVRTLLAYAIAGATPGSGAVTVTCSANVSRKAIGLSECTGYNTGTPSAQSATNNGTGATLTATYAGGLTATSMSVAAIGDQDGTATVGVADGNYTEIFDVDSGGATTTITLQGMYDLASADTTADWDTLAAVLNVAVALEISEAAAAGGNVNLLSGKFGQKLVGKL